jgi:hypothetical protein
MYANEQLIRSLFDAFGRRDLNEALCLLHVSEEAAAPRPGGLFTTCSHDTWTPPASVRASHGRRLR